MAFVRNATALQPADLDTVGRVFDQAWQTIAPEVARRSDNVMDARSRLAKIVLELADLRQLGPKQLKASSLRIFRECQHAPSAVGR
jgi:hypothetical protein